MPEMFGRALRTQREQRNISLNTIAEETKINIALLEALERDDVSRWPTGIFRRAFIRAYARAIGVDPEAAVREFLEAYPDPLERAAQSEAEVAEAASQGGFRLRLGSAFRTLAGDRADTSNIDFGRLAPAAPAASTTPPQAPPQVPESAPALPSAPISRTVDLQATAEACTSLARQPGNAELLAAIADIAGATGVIVWAWQTEPGALVPVLAHGYPPAMLARVPGVPADANNATAAAYRAGLIRIVDGTETDTGALALPVFGPDGCVGVFALEFAAGGEQDRGVQAIATIFAAQLSSTIAALRAQPLGDRKLA